MKFRAGDAVKHKPTGHTYSVGAVDEQGNVYPNGWPPGYVRESDCELDEAATDEEHAKAVLEWVAKDHGSDHGYPDDRVRINQRTAVELGLAEYVDVDCVYCHGSGKQQQWRLKAEVGVSS